MALDFCSFVAVYSLASIVKDPLMDKLGPRQLLGCHAPCCQPSITDNNSSELLPYHGQCCQFCVRSCYTNSTLGSVVPLAMFQLLSRKFKKTLMARENPPPFMANAILNFHISFLIFHLGNQYHDSEANNIFSNHLFGDMV